MPKKKKRNISKRINKNMTMVNKFMFGDSELDKLRKRRRKR